MKTTINIHDNSIVVSKQFKKRIREIVNGELNSHGLENAQSIDIIAMGMGKSPSYGDYYNFVRLAINDFDWTIRVDNRDSVTYDGLQDGYMNPIKLSIQLKKICLRTLQGGIGRLVDELIDNEVVSQMELERI